MAQGDEWCFLLPKIKGDGTEKDAFFSFSNDPQYMEFGRFE